MMKSYKSYIQNYMLYIYNEYINYIIYYMHTGSLQSCLTSLRPYRMLLTRLLCPWDSPSKNTGVGYHSPPGDLPDPGIKPASLLSLALAGGFFTTSTIWEAHNILYKCIYLMLIFYLHINILIHTCLFYIVYIIMLYII